jgi:hypothetical protein
VHRLPEKCPRCDSYIGSSAELKKHLRNVQTREIKPAPPSDDGFTREQEDQLRSKVGAQSKSEVDKLDEIYRILFPNDDISGMPSPC